MKILAIVVENPIFRSKVIHYDGSVAATPFKVTQSLDQNASFSSLRRGGFVL